jgi:hypothetical protein
MTVTDSSESLDIPTCVASSKTNSFTLSNLCPKYTKGEIIFDSPIDIIKKFDDVIFDNLTEVSIGEEYFYMPERFAKYFYGSTDLWWLVLYSGRLSKHTEFCIPKLNIASPSILPKIKELITTCEKELNSSIETEDLTIFPIKV